ncbi:hypothetical protein JI739_19070 [Ramlibacter sp. AW1]|uniref:Uncharacterized protein n=1 Tax=Ramlibacter aurantiacus TaxID=2801330 RepID=A0A936ZKB0_9BURK|nr:hypothetical protein [Ramlibacter aurantiacus]MBL0422457.1 hypothetical protein [Ramlibacter aurantiacus]
MPIQSGDVKLLKSAVMADVPEGGGAPTGNAIADGTSNAIFPDISELDRAGGRVSLRKTFLGIQTDDTDTYFGANVIVADPPQDPRVSVTLFSTKNTFDTRTQAASRIESYLTRGPEWGGYMYENHIVGQRVIQLFQRPSEQLPNVGQTLVLIHNEGLSTEKVQYVRATAVSAKERTFTFDQSGAATDYKANIVTVELSDALRYDFAGSPASRYFQRAASGTKLRDTTVADAGTYVGVVPLVDAAGLGDLTVKAASMFTQLVPSAQTETPISDVRSNGVSAALVATGAAITRTLNLIFNNSQAMHVGAPIYPGSLSIDRSGVTLTDAGGRLMNVGTEVGRVDYDNGIVTLAAPSVFSSEGSSAAHAVTFIPADVPDLITDQRAIPVTIESRSQSYAFVLDDIPLKRTLAISYLAQGRWYTLREDGSGAIKGLDSAYGVGTLSFTTGSVVVTLGALPDVGSRIIIQSASAVNTVPATNTLLSHGSKVYFPLNTSGDLSEEKGEKAIKIGSAIIKWDHGGMKTATDNGLGQLTGDATGSVDYTEGVVRISPNAMPPAGTVFLLDIDGDITTSVSVDVLSGYLGATNIRPGSVRFYASVKFTYGLGFSTNQLLFQERVVSVLVRDNGAGVLYFKDPGNNQNVNCGTIDYAAGTIENNSVVPVSEFDISGPSRNVQWYGVIGSGYGHQGTTQQRWNDIQEYTNNNRSRQCELLASAVSVSYSNSTASADSISIKANACCLRTEMVPNYTLRGANFMLGGVLYKQLPDNTLVRDPSPTTGGGTPSGSVAGASGVLTLSYWVAGQAPTVSNWRGVIAPPTAGLTAPFATSYTVFRTAASPLRPGSFSVLGTLMDGTSFNVAAGVDGKINGTRVKGRVDYEYGVIELYFVNPSGPAELNTDLSHLQIAGLTTIPADLVMINSIRYNTVSYSYLPLDAELLGIDPVRLPSDGRVPIFRAGGFAVVGHTGAITATVSNNQTINCGRVRLSRVRVIDSNGQVVNTGYTADLEAGTVTFTNVAGYAQPVTVQHRIEDMAVVREASINGEISFTRALTHNYPAGSYVSSALIAGDLFARTNIVFDQASWDGTWQDTVKGAVATATYNVAQFPIAVTNRGAISERWIIRFTNTTSFDVIGENVGVIASGTVTSVCAPINPATGVPYFSIDPLGWGAGWAVGNVMRFNTVGAQFPVWVVRTVQQGPETVPDDQFTLLIRGDVDTL